MFFLFSNMIHEPAIIK